MPSEKPFHHRTTLKQINKPFKSKHATKGALKDQAKGKTNRKPIKQVRSNFISKADRRNAAKLEQQKKRAEIVKTNRLFEGRHGAPRIVAVVPLCSDVNSYDVVKSICSSIDQPIPSVTKGISFLNAERFKQKIQFVLLDRNFIDIIDACKVADFILFVISADVEADQFGELCLQAIQSQGFPTLITIAMHMEKVPQKKRNDVKKSLLSFINYFFPDEEKVHVSDQSQDVLNVLRIICTQRPKQILWRETRPYMLAEELIFDADSSDNFGTLRVSGYVRGLAFSANRLVHLQNFGDFQLNKITTSNLKNHEDGRDMAKDIQILEVPNPGEQDSLIAENEPNLMESDQTWPTEEEMSGYEHRAKPTGDIPDALPGTTPSRIIKRVPKGTSAYQAAWIVDSESDSEYIYSDEEGDISMAYEEESKVVDVKDTREDDDVEYEEIEVEDKNSKSMIHMDHEEEERQLKEYLAKREKERRDDLEFPDEVDTPLEIAARTRFQKYRGLESFRTSPWDPYENLPIDYARIYQFENYKRTKKRVVSLASVGGSKVKVGALITLHIANIPRELAETYDPSRPFVVFGLLEYEHKISVLNFVITPNSEYHDPVKSKDPLIMHYGFRRYKVSPLYSQNTLGGKGTNNVHKYERFLNPGRTCVATIYGPIQIGKVPVTLYKETDDVNSPIFVSNGFFSNSDPQRIIAKRIILTGHPFKINKKSAVVRYMFFNSDDVLWFKPIQLVTKYGRIGHIRESLGTHGYMKCIFDSPITQQDTVMMNLYKRVFPKWNTTLLWRGGLKATNATSSEDQGKMKDLKINEQDVEMTV
ncbi:9787_t:CDS:10 [Acaulospora morrowiae]|uniref:9787_t:CDS:1 n=1 Tax=Acaulospora morrowiae TaxID=94023 RepID=A0A9N8ZPV8_9GLOM|nr:9787_t:CDS:10 [Acaulospora morrowiae]